MTVSETDALLREALLALTRIHSELDEYVTGNDDKVGIGIAIAFEVARATIDKIRIRTVLEPAPPAPELDEERVERVARAMATSDGTVWEIQDDTRARSVCLNDLGRAKFRAFARAAIRAMEE